MPFSAPSSLHRRKSRCRWRGVPAWAGEALAILGMLPPHSATFGKGGGECEILQMIRTIHTVAEAETMYAQLVDSAARTAARLSGFNAEPMALGGGIGEEGTF